MKKKNQSLLVIIVGVAAVLVGGMLVLFYQFDSGLEEIRHFSRLPVTTPWPRLSPEEKEKLRNEISQGRCTQWGEARAIGQLPLDALPEASGLTLLDQRIPYPTLLIHINDGAARPALVLTTLEGSSARMIPLNQVSLMDGEDLSVGPCSFAGKEDGCLFLADMGDNHLQRQQRQILLFSLQELLTQTKTATPSRILSLQFPAGVFHNVEAMSVHPLSGDLFFLTKESSNRDRDIKKREVPPASLYRLQRKVWDQLQQQAKAESISVTPEKVGTISMLQMVESEKSRAQLITSMDIAPDGKSFVILTYQHAYELFFDLSQEVDLKRLRQGLGKEGEQWKKIKLQKLPQQEAITFRVSVDKLGQVKRPWSLLYTSEYRGSALPIMEIPCLY